MFLEFYGLREQPFGVTPDPAYLYPSRTHREALDSLSYGIKADRGFMALIAEPGMGKTTLLYQLLEELHESARTVFLFQTQCDSRDFFCYLLTELGVDSRGMGLVAMHNKLNELLFSEMLARKRFVVFVDEAQNLSESVLETIRLLSDFETPHVKLLQIVLAGQPELAKKLADPRLSQLRQRVATWSRLKRFATAETIGYIEHRLRVAGHAGGPLFTPDALAVIAEQSRGIPRNINNICFNALSLGHARGHSSISAEVVQEVMTNSDLDSIVRESHISNPPVVPAPSPAPLRLTYTPVEPHALETAAWRGAALGGILLAATLLVTSVGALYRAWHSRADSRAVREEANPARPGARASSPRPLLPVGGSVSGGMPYAADPQDVGSGQILTVVAGPGQTLEEISLRYLGRFDEKLRDEICSLNPELRDPNQLEGGQLILLPLPAETLKKVLDTAEPADISGKQPGKRR